MGPQTISTPQSEAMEEGSTEIGLPRVAVLEALAEPVQAIGPSRSNQSTAVQGDPDDQ